MIQINFFKPPSSNLTPSQTMLLTALFEMIRTDIGYKEKINKLRALKDKTQRDTYKKSELGGVTLCGTFSQRLDKYLIKHSQVINVKIIGLNEKEMLSTSEGLKDLHEELVGYFISSCGNGFNVLIRVDNSKFSNKENYLAALTFLQKNMLSTERKCLPCLKTTALHT